VLGRELRRLERHASRLDDRRDDARREKRSRLRALGRSRHGIGDVAIRRDRAESTLGYLIATMVGLARRKAGARSMASPARTGFRRPARGPVTQGFGCTGFRLEPRRGRCAHFHDGIDIAGRRGSRVRAAAEGVVAYVGWNPWDVDERAYIVIVVHRGGYQTVYGHLLPVRKTRAGEAVRRGQVIGLLGSTGNSTGPHVHWEVQRGNTAIDPRSVG
jgi:murein DD-endopeptidase MepM/ murein hydrolase activator NlpD